jgi:hypothetical protein
MVPIAPTRKRVCEIRDIEGYLCGRVGPGGAGEVQRCYEDWAIACLDRQCSAALLVGSSDGDAFPHLAARDAIASIALAGMPAGFRLGVVALNATLIAVYDAVVVEAQRRGIQARRFQSEDEAMAWLRAA